MVRRPIAAGLFYPSDSYVLKESIENSFLHKIGPGKKPPSIEPFKKISALISPHAGYTYSGPVAAHGYYACSSLKNVELIIIVGPNHHGVGSGVATVREGMWETSLGKVKVDNELTKRLVEVSGIVDLDDTAHKHEHSIEVQIPFLQYVYGDSFKILPISMLLQDINTAVELGKAISQIIRDKDSLIIASSDFTHYEDQRTASKKDSEAIKAILKMDVPLLYDTIERMKISICGYGPIITTITAVKSLNVNEVQLLKYATSGDITGDYSSVVGYASLIFSQ